MRNLLLGVIAVGIATSVAIGANINIKVQGSGGESEVTVLPGATVNYRIIGDLSDDQNEGLALIGLSLDFTGDALAANSIVLPTACDDPNTVLTCNDPMSAFIKTCGVTNPDGFGGTLIGGDLIQIGGAQNTINNTAENALFPIGAVLTGVARPGPRAGGCGTAVIATGSLIAPNAPGDYFLNAFDVFANVIKLGETGEVFWATEAAGVGAVNKLTVHVQDECAAVAATVWESVVSHLPNFAAGDVALVIPDGGLFSEPRTSVSKIVVSFNGNIDPKSAVPGSIAVAGRNAAGDLLDLSGTTIGTSVAASDKLEIIFTPALPDFARYRITLSGIENTCGGAVETGTQRIFTALRGDASGDRRVNATDVGGVRSLVGTNPINPAVLNHVRSDANDDGRINATDVGGVRSLVGRDARAIADP